MRGTATEERDEELDSADIRALLAEARQSERRGAWGRTAAAVGFFALTGTPFVFEIRQTSAALEQVAQRVTEMDAQIQETNGLLAKLVNTRWHLDMEQHTKDALRDLEGLKKATSDAKSDLENAMGKKKVTPQEGTLLERLEAAKTTLGPQPKNTAQNDLNGTLSDAVSVAGDVKTRVETARIALGGDGGVESVVGEKEEGLYRLAEIKERTEKAYAALGNKKDFEDVIGKPDGGLALLQEVKTRTESAYKALGGPNVPDLGSPGDGGATATGLYALPVIADRLNKVSSDISAAEQALVDIAAIRRRLEDIRGKLESLENQLDAGRAQDAGSVGGDR